MVVGNGTGFPDIDGNQLTYNGQTNYVGIIVDNSLARIRSNYISNSAGGIYAVNYSNNVSSTDTVSYREEGNNTVINTNSALQAQDYSRMTVGYVWSDQTGTFYYGSCNDIYNNTMNASSLSGAELSVEGNWWGSDPPDFNKFSNNGGNLLYSFWRSAAGGDCSPGGPLLPGQIGQSLFMASRATGQSSAATSDLDQAWEASITKQWPKAEALYIKVLSESNDQVERCRALAGLYHEFQEVRDQRLVGDIAQYRTEASEVGTMASELVASMYVATGRFEEAKQILSNLRALYPNSDVEKRSLLMLASLGGFSASEGAVSSQALSELRQKYGSSVDAGLLAALGSRAGTAPPASQTTAQDGEMSLDNYPNPFNPTTRFEFRVGRPSHVLLRIYDILGRVVASLVDEEKLPGKYNITWDASSVASGVYFAKIESGGKSLVTKVSLVR